MADVLTAPLAVAALVLIVAGVAKLRAPAPAAAALRELGLPAAALAIRAFAAGEIALGVWALAAPTSVAAIALACCYAAFAVLALLLASRRAACGCFGEGDFPASRAQALLSARAGGGVRGSGRVAPARAPGSPRRSGRGPRDRDRGIRVRHRARLHAAAGRVVGVERAMSVSERFAGAVGRLLERKVSRRSALSRAALAGSAFAVAPVRYMIRPGRRGPCSRPEHCRRRAVHATATRRSAARSSSGNNRCPGGHVRRRLVEVHRLRGPRAVRRRRGPLLHRLQPGAGHGVPGRLPVRQRGLQPPLRGLQPLPLRPVQHADRRDHRGGVPAGHLPAPGDGARHELQRHPEARRPHLRARGALPEGSRRTAARERAGRDGRAGVGRDRAAGAAAGAAWRGCCAATPRSCAGSGPRRRARAAFGSRLGRSPR